MTDSHNACSAGSEHDLYRTGDRGAPDQIKDRNGEVVLGLCKKCGRAEIELSEPCVTSSMLSVGDVQREFYAWWEANQVDRLHGMIAQNCALAAWHDAYDRYVRQQPHTFTDAQSVGMREEEILAMALIINPFADELDDRDGGKLFDAARRLWTAGYRKSGGGFAVGVPAPMQGSSDCGLAQDAERPEDTTQGDRPAHPVTYPSDSHLSAGNGHELPKAAQELARKYDWCPSCHRGWTWCGKNSDGSLSEGNANVGDRIGRTRRPAHPMDTISGGPIGPSEAIPVEPQEAQVTVCTNCGGGGWLETVRCKRCKGRGFR